MPDFKVYVGVKPLPGGACRQIVREIHGADSAEDAIAKAREEVTRGRRELDMEEGLTFACEAGTSDWYRIDIDLPTWAKQNGIALPYTFEAGYCVSYNSMREHGGTKTYSNWEDDHATPAIKAAGYEVTWCWVDAEADGFGPLSRSINATKGGLFYQFSYG